MIQDNPTLQIVVVCGVVFLGVVGATGTVALAIVDPGHVFVMAPMLLTLVATMCTGLWNMLRTQEAALKASEAKHFTASAAAAVVNSANATHLMVKSVNSKVEEVKETINGQKTEMLAEIDRLRLRITEWQQQAIREGRPEPPHEDTGPCLP